MAADTSCDESCVAIIDTESWCLLADVVHSHVGKMTEFGGVVPEVASREHLKALPLAVHEALSRSSLSLKDIDHFAVTNRPGLIGALLVGLSHIKALAYAEKKPFSVINHIEGHLYSPLLSTLKTADTAVTSPPPFPWIALVVSGGHSELYYVKNEMENEWIGGTADDAAGEAFDKIGKLLGLAYPAGPVIDRWVRESASDLDRITHKFPIAQLEGPNFSFSGLKTAVLLALRKIKSPTEQDKLAIAASAQEMILRALVDKARLAIKQYPGASLVVTGGVACNSRFRELAPEAYFPRPKHCTDNAAMIAVVAGMRAKRGELPIADWTTTAIPHLA